MVAQTEQSLFTWPQSAILLQAFKQKTNMSGGLRSLNQDLEPNEHLKIQCSYVLIVIKYMIQISVYLYC